MATRTDYLNSQYLTDIYAKVIGLYGDPANQIISSDGTSLTDAFSLFSWNNIAAGDRTAIMFWSRVLLVEILKPSDPSYMLSDLALVLKPRSCWLYDYDGSNLVSDYIGNTANPLTLGTISDNSSINKITPEYRFGDVIRIASLPAVVPISNTNGFSDGYTHGNEYYDNKTTVRNASLNIVNTMQINGASYNSRYSTMTPTSILYYDKNIDARSRFGVSTVDEGNTVTITLCEGGINSLYQIKGTKIS